MCKKKTKKKTSESYLSESSNYLFFLITYKLVQSTVTEIYKCYGFSRSEIELGNPITTEMKVRRWLDVLISKFDYSDCN